MSKNSEPAVNCWEVDRQLCGQTLRPVCVVILRSKKNKGTAIVKATSSDLESMNRYAGQMTDDLYMLSNDEFVDKYRLGQTA